MHSPFVFDFIQHVLNDKKKYERYEKIEAVRKDLLNNNSVIRVQDFGAGSTVIKTNERMIKKMARSSLKPKKFAQLLFRIVKHYQPSSILELGTSFGITTAYLASGNISATVHTCEGAPEIARIALHNFDQLQLNNIKITQGDFTITLPALLNTLNIIDFVFIDGNHRKTPTLLYFEQLLKHSGNGSIFIFDDIHWSIEMEEAWEEIKNNPAVTQTIDLFFIGIALFNVNFVAKQHHVIRF
ncbi:MAG: class I SAM-dependent methyltransferase [Ferruginibacter sp.]